MAESPIGGTSMRMLGSLACLVAAIAGSAVARDGLDGPEAGDEKTIAAIKLCWCPPGTFTMGSPPGEPERRPGEDQVEVTLTKGFWMGKYEATQGQWKRVMGQLPGELTAELPAGDDFPVGNVNFAEAEAFCHKLTCDSSTHRFGFFVNASFRFVVCGCVNASFRLRDVPWSGGRPDCPGLSVWV